MNESEIFVFLRQVWWSAKKKRVVRGEGENKNEGKKRHRQCEN